MYIMCIYYVCIGPCIHDIFYTHLQCDVDSKYLFLNKKMTKNCKVLVDNFRSFYFVYY